jgi:hypothetical protein
MQQGKFHKHLVKFSINRREVGTRLVMVRIRECGGSKVRLINLSPILSFRERTCAPASRYLSR